MRRHPTPEDFDHAHDLRKHEPRPSDLPPSQRLAVASLIGQCEAIAASGRLSESSEQSLRLLIVETCNAFGMPTKAERVAA